MITRNKKLIIILSICLLVSVVTSVALVYIFDNTDILPISFIISALLVLLFINGRSSSKTKNDFKKKYYKEKVETNNTYKEQQLILWIFFGLLVVLCILTGLTL